MNICTNKKFFFKKNFYYFLLGFFFLIAVSFHCCLQSLLRASHCGGFSFYAAQALGAQRLQYLWLSGLTAPWHVESSWARDRTRVPCTGRRILIHCTTREVAHEKFLRLLTHGWEVLTANEENLLWSWASLSLSLGNFFLFFGLKFFRMYLFLIEGLIALQYCVGFNQTSTWISHKCTHVPSYLNIPSTLLTQSALLGCYLALVWVPWRTQQIPTGRLFYVW